MILKYIYIYIYIYAYTHAQQMGYVRLHASIAGKQAQLVEFP